VILPFVTTLCLQYRKSRDVHDASLLLQIFVFSANKVAVMRCSIRHLRSGHLTDSPPESAAAVSSVGISNLFPELLTIIFSYLEVRDKGCAAQVNELQVNPNIVDRKTILLTPPTFSPLS